MLNSLFSYQSPTFKITGQLTTNAGLFAMQVNSQQLTTFSFPRTTNILKKYLPSVLKSQCFNDDHLPFSSEVKDTNLAHLFEHLLIEHLCLEELSNGSQIADFSGITSWDWTKSPRGFYSISLNASQKHSAIFHLAFTKSIFLLEKILSSNSQKSRQLN